MLLCSKVSMALNENNDSVTENQVLLYVFYLENFLYKIDLLKKCTLEDRKKTHQFNQFLIRTMECDA